MNDFSHRSSPTRLRKCTMPCPCLRQGAHRFIAERNCQIMNVKAFVIHLERAVARRANVEEIIGACPVLAEIQLATDGQCLPSEEIARVYVPGIHCPIYPFRLRAGEVAIFISHRACWQKVLDENLDAALILEDDIRIEPETFADTFRWACEHVEALGYIQFATRPLRTKHRTLRLYPAPSASKICEPFVVPLRAHAQIVSAESASRLLASTSRIDRPVDTFLQLRTITGQRVFTMCPSGISEISSGIGGSTIHSKEKRENWLEREWSRFVYRLKVRRLSSRDWLSSDHV